MFYAYAPGATVYLGSDTIVLELLREPGDDFRGGRGSVGAERRVPSGTCRLTLRFAGVTSIPLVEGRCPESSAYNFFVGPDSSRWRSYVTCYGEVVYHDLWPGVDLVFRNRNGEIQYDVFVQGEADPGNMQIIYSGQEAPHDLLRGGLDVEVGSGRFVSTPPVPNRKPGVLWVGGPGQDRDVCSVAGTSPGGDGDSTLAWATFLFASEGGSANSVVMDSDGCPIFTGSTWGRTCIAKLSATGDTLLWCTYIGGCAGCSDVWRVILDKWDRPIVVGSTYAEDFPTTAGAFDPSPNGTDDAFVLKLDPSGSELVWSTLLGGSAEDVGWDLQVDAAGTLFVIGRTRSTDFPVTGGAFDSSHNGEDDCFVCKISPSGSDLIWGTFVGGDDGDYGLGEALDAHGDVFVTGYTSSANFPVTSGAYDRSRCEWSDAFVFKLAGSDGRLEWSSLLGGCSVDYAKALVVDQAGNPIVAGNTGSSDFPTTAGAYDESYNVSMDVFVTKMHSSGRSIVWSTFVGSVESDDCSAIAVNNLDEPVITGSCGPDHAERVWAAGLTSAGSGIQWRTELSGRCSDFSYGLCMDRWGSPIIVGATCSIDFPATAGAYQTRVSRLGPYYGFLAKLDVPSGRGPSPLGAEVGLPFPNPFAVSVETAVRMEPHQWLRVSVHDVRGRRVAKLADYATPAAITRITWNGADDDGNAVSPGIYFLRMEAGTYRAARKVVLLR